MTLRLPRRITLPFGYVVSVRQVSRAEMDAAGGEGCDGLWLVDGRRILVLQRLPAARKRYVLVHELHHAVLDSAHHLTNEGVIRG